MSSQGSLELLKETELNRDQLELVHTISSSNSVLMVLIEDILQLVKFEFENNHTEMIESQSVDLAGCLDYLKRMISGYAAQFSVTLKYQVDEVINNLFVYSNRHRIQQFLTNLLTNAIKASKSNGLVELSCEKVTENEDTVEVSFQVKDFGSGIPKEKINSIFEPFIQLHNVNESVVPG